MRKRCNAVVLVPITADVLLLLVFIVWPWFGSREGMGVALWERTILLMRLGALVSIVALAFSILVTMRRTRLWLVILSLGLLAFWFTMSIPASDFLAVERARSSSHTSP